VTRQLSMEPVASENGDGFLIDEGTVGNTFQNNVAIGNIGRGGIYGGTIERQSFRRQ
jgi:hypothetical protein